MHECKKEDVLKLMQGDLTEIKSDVKILLSFKAKIIGIVLASSVGATILFNLVAK